MVEPQPLPSAARSDYLRFAPHGIRPRSQNVLAGAILKKPNLELIRNVGIQVRRAGAQSVINSHAIATHFGLHTTDLECLDLIFLRGRVTAGELAQATGLTSGATTTLIDRLERAGYVERENDPGDRRRRFVRIRPEAIKPIQAVYEPMQSGMFKLWSSFSESDLRVIEDFLKRSTDLAVAYIETIQGREKGKPGR